MDNKGTATTMAVGGGGTLITAILTALQYDEALKWVNLALSILTAIVTLAFTIWRWYMKAKKDDKITLDEVNELITEVKHNIEEANEKMKEGEKENEESGSTGESD